MTYAPATSASIETLTVKSAPAATIFGSGNTAPASVAYPLANQAFYVPFSVSKTVTAYEGWVVSGATAGGNFDIGIYDAAGARLSSAGATARTASVVNNTTTMTDTVLVPRVRYYMAFAADSLNTYFCIVPAAQLIEAAGVLSSTSSYVLPSGPTLSRTTTAYLPYFGLNLYTVAL